MVGGGSSPLGRTWKAPHVEAFSCRGAAVEAVRRWTSEASLYPREARSAGNYQAGHSSIGAPKSPRLRSAAESQSSAPAGTVGGMPTVSLRASIKGTSGGACRRSSTGSSPDSPRPGRLRLAGCHRRHAPLRGRDTRWDGRIGWGVRLRDRLDGRGCGVGWRDACGNGRVGLFCGHGSSLHLPGSTRRHSSEAASPTSGPHL